MGHPARKISDIQETVIHYLITEYANNKPLLRKLKSFEEELLTVEEVAEMLKCSEQTVRKMIKSGDWKMVKGPNGYTMTWAQYREQRDLMLAKAERGF